MKDILKFLEERKLTQEEAIKILEKNLPYQNTWKMWRFTLYLWARHKEQGVGKLGTRKDTVEKVVNSPRYKKLYDTFPLPKFNAKIEHIKLNGKRMYIVVEGRYPTVKIAENTGKNIKKSLSYESIVKNHK